MKKFTTFLYICSMKKKNQQKRREETALLNRLTNRFAVFIFVCATLTGCGGGNDGLSNSLTDDKTDQETVTSIPDTYEYELPVVFHVLYKDKNDALQYPSKKRLELILDSVNALYRRNKMNITFKMATEDENGNRLSEAGIIRYAVSFEEYDETDFLSSTSTYGKYTQNLKKFINIFLFRFSSKDDRESLGITTLPIMPKEHPLDGLNDTTSTFLSRVRKFTNPWGVCINNKYINRDQPAEKVEPKCVWNTLAHELGHYLGLHHTFSENGCDDTDYCDDTYSCNYTQYLDDLKYYMDSHIPRSFFELPKRIDCETAHEYYADNIMDYMYTLCEVLTKQQRERTRHVLNYAPLVPGTKIGETRGSEAIPSEPTNIRPRLSNCPKVRF